VPRDRQRICLQDGLKLALNRLIRQGFVRPGECTGPVSIQWLNSETGEVRASGLITANLRGYEEGWFHFKSSSIDQWLTLAAVPRHFGGRQWYFICPTTARLASVLWKLPGSTQFRSRHAWGRSILSMMFRSAIISSTVSLSVSSSFRLRIRSRNARSSAESFDGFLVRDIAAIAPHVTHCSKPSAPNRRVDAEAARKRRVAACPSGQIERSGTPPDETGRQAFADRPNASDCQPDDTMRLLDAAGRHYAEHHCFAYRSIHSRLLKTLGTST
jgi:hypothetical protein